MMEFLEMWWKYQNFLHIITYDTKLNKEKIIEHEIHRKMNLTGTAFG